jgi:hypothetical protein
MTACATSASQRALLLVKVAANDAKNVLRWKIQRGASTAIDAFADPVAGAQAIRVCLYDTSSAAQPVTSIVVPAGGTCNGKPCWRPLGSSGYRYKNRAATHDGVTDMKLKVAGSGELQLLVKGRGSALPVPTLPLVTPVTAQLAIAGECWQAHFVGSLHNDAASFRAVQP